MSKWIDFIETGDTGKTKIFDVVPKELPAPTIAQIRWYGPWRKYALFPTDGINTVFETQCLSDIIQFINKLMEERKKK